VSRNVDATWLDTFRFRRRGTGRPWIRPGTRIVELPKASVRVREAGSGPIAIVFVADPPNVIEHYDALFERLAPWACVICFEAPGFGFSIPRRGYRFALADQVETMRELLVALERGPYVLAFSCVASFAALTLAAESPELVRQLVLMQVPSWPEEVKWMRRVDRGGLIATPVVGQLLMKARPRWVTRQWYEVALPSGRNREPFLQPALSALEGGGTLSLASAFQALRGAAPPASGPILHPTLVVWGSADRTHRRTDRRSILEHVPRAAIVEFETSGHFPELEDPGRFCDLLHRFVHDF